MASENGHVEISICMGRSCASLGNDRHVAIVQEYIARRGLRDRVEIKGRLCSGLCRLGPNVCVDGRLYQGVTPASLIDILDDHFASVM